MLHWPLNEHNKYLLLLELFFVSAFFHGILGILLFIVYPKKQDSFCIELGKTKSPTLFMPLRSAMPVVHAARSSRRGAGRGHITGGKTHGSKPAQPLEERAPVVRKAQLASDVTLGFQDKKSAKQTLTNKKRDSKTKKAHACQKSQQKKNAHEACKSAKQAKNTKVNSKIELKKKQPEKKELQKNSKQDVMEPVKSVQPQIQREPEPVAKPIIKEPETIQERKEIQQGVQQETPDIPDDMLFEQVVLGNEPVDGEYISAEQARMYECIEQEIVSRWRPPCGLSKDLVCHIKCSIGNDGSVDSCITEKSSGVLIYDMAARMASLAMKLPRWAWGKDFTIVYKQ